jgi:hypothetical protein
MFAKNFKKRTTVVQAFKTYQKYLVGLVSSSKAHPKIING